MQNLLDPLTFDREAGVVHSAAGDGATPVIDIRDIATVTATVLAQDGHAGETYTLTGPEAVSYREATRTLARILGRTLEYRAGSLDEAWRRRRDAGQPVWLAAAQLAIVEYQRAGGPTARTTDTVETITGRAPGSLEQFVRDHAELLSAG